MPASTSDILPDDGTNGTLIGRLWRKGEESGNVQEVREIYLDCDADTILLKVHQKGRAACHEGYSSCFFRRVASDGLQVISARVFDPKQVYQK